MKLKTTIFRNIILFRNTLFIYKFNVMRQSKKLLFGACLLLSGMAFAQGPSHPKYIGETTNTTFANAYKNWVPGTPLFKGEDIEDNEEFYISRVKPKERFTDADTQVNTQKKIIMVVPHRNCFR